MGVYWGVDSWTPATYARSNSPLTFYDRIVASLTPPELKEKKIVRRPLFWGRYLSSLTLKEVAYLHEKRVGVLVLHNSFGKSSVKGNEVEGRRVADDAVRLASGVVTRNQSKVTIYANIDIGFEPTADWLVGWMKGIFNSPFGGVGGFYCNTLAGPFNASLGKALPRVAQAVSRELSVIQRYCKLFIMNSGQQRKWSSGNDLRKTQVTLNFSPAQCSTHPTGSAIWQSDIDVFRQPGNDMGGVDINIINDNGYDGMFWPS